MNSTTPKQAAPAYFYDIHMHAMNLSHPALSGLLCRRDLRNKLRYLSWSGMLGRILQKKFLERYINMLVVMENDTASLFMLMERYLCDPHNPIVQGSTLTLFDREYTKIVLTPLMIDFSATTLDFNVHYPPPNKPISEQVHDLINGIAKYNDKSPLHLLDIRPFMGLNTLHRDLNNDLKPLLCSHFEDKSQDMSCAGIKVYPALGFDPWPSSRDEQHKVAYVYDFCIERGIPITAHCNRGGFVCGNPTQVEKRTHPLRWQKGLDQERFSNLKVNLAHFMSEKRWTPHVLRLLQRFKQVYTDISFVGANIGYYRKLGSLLRRLPSKNTACVRDRLLFGTDFMISLSRLPSYNHQYDLFIRTRHITNEDKHKICSANPKRFLERTT